MKIANKFGVVALIAIIVLASVTLHHCHGQIRIGEPQCVVREGTPTSMYSVTFVDACSMWSGPHLANPFFLMILTQNWIISFLVSGVFEIVETLMVAIFRNFAFFPGDENNLENMVDSLVDDWLIQGSLGVLLGAWVIWYFKPPQLWRGWYTDRGVFMWWLLWYLLVMVSQASFGIKLNDDTNDFPLGPTIAVIIISCVFAFMIQTEPKMEEAWDGRTARSRMEFWMAVVAIYFSFYYVVQFDWCVGSSPQTWIMWGIWIIVFFVFALINGRGAEIYQLLQWQQNYLSRKATILKEHSQEMYYAVKYYIS